MSDLSAPGATSTENGGFSSILDKFSSFGDAIAGIGATAVNVTGSVFSTIRGVEDAINPPSNNGNTFQATGTTGSNPIQSAAPASLQGFLSTDNLLIGGGVALGAIGLIIALRG